MSITAVRPADLRFTPTADDAEFVRYSILVAALDETGAQTMAVTGNKRKAIAAFNAYYRILCGFVNLLDRPGLTYADAERHITQERVHFTRIPDAPDDGQSWWTTEPADDSPDGVTVTLLHDYPILPSGWPLRSMYQPINFEVGDRITDARCGVEVTGTVTRVDGTSVWYRDTCRFCQPEVSFAGHRTQSSFPTTWRALEEAS